MWLDRHIPLGFDVDNGASQARYGLCHVPQTDSGRLEPAGLGKLPQHALLRSGCTGGGVNIKGG
ncbi:hypothetical protein PGQ11_010275 [Apiospora arundinis]|uniref:Uncharacterized protein n=1 Tax=Apiospora arundinis TaxID=335852 RepID=A0ABR2I9Q9_9PEZI